MRRRTGGAVVTDEEVMREIRAGSASVFNRARAVFSSASAEIEQAGQQRQPLNPIELRRMEFEAVDAILSAAGFAPHEWRE